MKHITGSIFAIFSLAFMAFGVLELGTWKSSFNSSWKARQVFWRSEAFPREVSQVPEVRDSTLFTMLHLTSERLSCLSRGGCIQISYR